MFDMRSSKTGLFVFLVLASGFCSTALAKTRISADVFAPSTQPAGPLERLAAMDQPLAKRNAAGQMAEWLAAFDVPVRQFTYSIQPLEENEETRVYRVEYPSPFHSPFKQNNTVPAEYYVPRVAAGTKEPAAIVLDILDGRAIIARSFARSLAAHGVAALYVPMAYYGPRRPPAQTHIQFFSADPTRSVDALRQTVMDIRRAKAILTSRAEVDAHQIGITGVSLGGIMTVLAAGVDGQFDRVLPVLSGGDLASLVFHTRETRGLARRLEEHGIDRDGLAKMLSPVEPLNFAERIDPAHCLMINGSDDEVIPRQTTDLLFHAIGNPQIFWVPTGHYGAILYLPQIQQTAANYLGGKIVDHFGF